MARVIRGRSEPTRAFAYDHNSGEKAFLALSAMACGWAEEPLENAWSDSEVAAALALRSEEGKGAEVLVVHLDEDGLGLLERRCRDNVTIVACSTAPHERVSGVPEIGRALLLRLRTPLSPGFSGAVLGGIVDALDEAGVRRLRLGFVPAALRGRFVFRKAPLVDALLILVQGAIGGCAGGRRATVEAAAWWRRGLGLKDGATEADSDCERPDLISHLALELGMERVEFEKAAPSTSRLLRSLRYRGGTTPQGCSWGIVKKELEDLLWPK